MCTWSLVLEPALTVDFESWKMKADKNCIKDLAMGSVSGPEENVCFLLDYIGGKVKSVTIFLVLSHKVPIEHTTTSLSFLNLCGGRGIFFFLRPNRAGRPNRSYQLKKRKYSKLMGFQCSIGTFKTPFYKDGCVECIGIEKKKL